MAKVFAKGMIPRSAGCCGTAQAKNYCPTAWSRARVCGDRWESDDWLKQNRSKINILNTIWLKSKTEMKTERATSDSVDVRLSDLQSLLYQITALN